jgi:hypothetical protein
MLEIEWDSTGAVRWLVRETDGVLDHFRAENRRPFNSGKDAITDAFKTLKLKWRRS